MPFPAHCVKRFVWFDKRAILAMSASTHNAACMSKNRGCISACQTATPDSICYTRDNHVPVVDKPGPLRRLVTSLQHLLPGYKSSHCLSHKVHGTILRLISGSNSKICLSTCRVQHPSGWWRRPHHSFSMTSNRSLCAKYQWSSAFATACKALSASALRLDISWSSSSHRLVRACAVHIRLSSLHADLVLCIVLPPWCQVMGKYLRVAICASDFMLPAQGLGD